MTTLIQIVGKIDWYFEHNGANICITGSILGLFLLLWLNN